MSRSRRGEVVDCNKIEFADIQNSPIIENFSIIPQKYTQWCYASATEAVLNYHNIRVTQEMIAKWYKKDGPCSTNKNGINCPQDPIEFLEQYFTVTKIDNNDKIISLLQNPINSPIIAFVDQHYIVIVGKDENSFIIMTLCTVLNLQVYLLVLKKYLVVVQLHTVYKKYRLNTLTKIIIHFKAPLKLEGFMY